LHCTSSPLYVHAQLPWQPPPWLDLSSWSIPQETVTIQIPYPLHFSIIKTLRQMVMTNQNPPHTLQQEVDDEEEWSHNLVLYMGMNLMPTKSIIIFDCAWPPKAGPLLSFSFLPLYANSAVPARYAFLMPWLPEKGANSTSCFFEDICYFLCQFPYQKRFDLGIIYRKHGKVTTFSHFWVAATLLAAQLVPRRCHNITMHWRPNRCSKTADWIYEDLRPVVDGWTSSMQF
jgi:hypothetical protein